MKRVIQLVCVAVIVAGLGSIASAVNIETVPVGNPGNAADTEVMAGGTTGYGAVDYEYNIGKYEVTVDQYTEFLNAVARDDPNGLYATYMQGTTAGCKISRSGSSGSYSYSVGGSRSNRPVNHVSWYDALRFANWLHNGQPTGAQDDSTTEDGSYDMSLGSGVVRKPGATWVLPTEDEWYKAAYYKGGGTDAGYWDYPTQSDSVPGNNIRLGFPWDENANYSQAIGYPLYRTLVGEFRYSDGPYGTFDQGGNVWEWNEALVGSDRGYRGGAYNNGGLTLHAYDRNDRSPTDQNSGGGFRVAEVPEPATLSVLALGGLAVLRRRCKR